jgi:hypothetical protein
MVVAALGGAAGITPFSAASPGSEQPPGWTPLRLPNVPAPQFTLVADEGTTVLRVTTQASAGALAFRFRDGARAPLLAWRWKVERALASADLRSRGGDDFPARVYVFFDVREADVPFVARVRIQLARLLYGTELPTAALCYVWDNREPPGATHWSAYTDRVRVIVLQSGNERAGRWIEERRDVAADFRAAFGVEPPAITGIAAGADTDQTGERSTAWFGDFRLEARS